MHQNALLFPSYHMVHIGHEKTGTRILGRKQVKVNPIRTEQLTKDKSEYCKLKQLPLS